MPAAMPEKIGKYELRGTLGRGAMGTVYDGWDPAIGRRVAIKTIRLADAHVNQGEADDEAAEALARFRREAQAAGRLSHANVVGVFDTGETDELAYIVMEFIEGRSLKQLLDARGALPPAEAAEIMGQVLAGLEYSHRRGVVHRDIKPANVMLTVDGQVKLADFGIARIASSSATAVGVIMGTPAYMPPEQFRGEPAEARSDIYTAGAMLFHLLTGTRPYEGNPASIMHRVLNAGAAPVPSARSVSVSPAWDSVIGRAMATRIEDRFATAAEFAGAVRRAAAGAAPEAAEDATMIARPARPAITTVPAGPSRPAVAAARVGRSATTPVLIAGGTIALVAVLVGGWFVWTPSPPVANEPVPVQPPKPPTAPPVVIPPIPPPRPPSAETIRDGLAKALATLPCSLASAVVQGGRVKVSGVAGDQAAAAIRRLADDAARPVTADVQAFSGPYCDMVDLLRPIAQARPLGLTIAEGVSPIKDAGIAHTIVTAPAFPAWLFVDYLSNNGTLQHVFPTVKQDIWPVRDPPRLFRPGEQLVFGQDGHTFIKAGPPFGTDMIVAVASSEKLFARTRLQGETLPAYVAALRAAIATAHATGAEVAADVALITTVPDSAAGAH